MLEYGDKLVRVCDSVEIELNTNRQKRENWHQKHQEWKKSHFIDDSRVYDNDARVDKLEFHIDDRDDYLVATFSGRLDLSISNDIELQLNQRIDEKQSSVIVDLTNVQYMSSSGLRILINLHAKLRKIDKTVLIGGASEMVRKLILVTEVSKMFPVFNSVDEAEEHLKKN